MTTYNSASPAEATDPLARGDHGSVPSSTHTSPIASDATDGNAKVGTKIDTLPEKGTIIPVRGPDEPFGSAEPFSLIDFHPRGRPTKPGAPATQKPSTPTTKPK